MPVDQRLLAAFGAGAVAALVLPKVFLCFLGTALLLVSVRTLHHIRRD